MSGFGHRFQFELKTMSDRKEGEEGEESVAMADEKDVRRTPIAGPARLMRRDERASQT